jgi:hypothetical protein
MWPMPALAHKFVCITFSSHSMGCCWIEKAEHGTAPLTLRAYKNYSLNNRELANLIIFNPTVIKEHITSFLSEHNLQDAFVAFSLHGPAVYEQFVTMPTATPHRNDFAVSNSAHMLWEYRYLYPNDEGQFVFYVYSVPRYIVLQYELLAVAAQCNLITITTQTMALLSAYEHMFGSAFRRSQLAIDMMQYNNNIGEIITMDDVRRMVMGLPVKVSVQEGATAAGLIWSERM